MTSASPGHEPQSPRNQERPQPGHWALILLVLLAFALRLYGLGSLELWFDEAISANISGLGWAGALEHLRSEPFEHPPLYYLSLYPWQRLAGAGEFALRFYSVVWGVLLVPLLYALVKRMADRRLALLSALLAAVSPFLVAYSQEARMYTLLPFLALALLLVFHRALVSGQRRWWLVYVVLALLGAATHYYFAWLWLTTTLYLLLSRSRPRGWRWGLGIQALFLLLVAGWFVVAPAARNSLLSALQNAGGADLAYKVNKVMPTLMLSELENPARPLLVSVIAAGGWVLTLLGVWHARSGRGLDRRLWQLLLLLLVVSLTLPLLFHEGVVGRHVGYGLVAALPFMALGLVALRRRGRGWLAVGILALLLMATYGLAHHYARDERNLGQALAYVDERGEPGDALISNQPAQYPLITYYNREGRPVYYLPPLNTGVTPALVNREMERISAQHGRIWLGPIGAWNADPDALVEQWLAAHAFQAEKTWFPDSHSVALYYTDGHDLRPIETGYFTWGGRIWLQSLHTGLLRVQAGEAVRLRFHWRSGFDLEERYTIDLALLDAKGQVWATRHSEPCGGVCLTSGWRASHLYEDRHALLIPPGTPPGIYRVEIAWSRVADGVSLPAERDGQPVEAVSLAQVQVLRPTSPDGQIESLPNPLDVTFGGQIALVGYEPAEAEAQPGGHVRLWTHWRAQTAPGGDLTLAAELVDDGDQTVAAWQSSPAADFYPTGQWQPGEYVRGQHAFKLPDTLPPGRYRLRVALLGPGGERLPVEGKRPRQALGGLIAWRERAAGASLILSTIQAVERSRRFDLPPVEHPLAARVGRQARLLGYDLDDAQPKPGERIHLTLYWQADGPMLKPFKVFTHLVDAEGAIRAQHDAPPGGGCCPANTWAAGEVIVDEHTITLGADLPRDAYQLVVGLYDEETDTRLAAYSADGDRFPDDRIPTGTILVGPTATEEPTVGGEGPIFTFEHQIFLPLLGGGQN